MSEQHNKMPLLTHITHGNGRLSYWLEGHDETISFSTTPDAIKAFELLRRIERALPADQGATSLKEEIEKLRQTFDALLIAEVQAYGGIPTFVGRCGAEQSALREAISNLLQEAALLAQETTQ